MGLFFKGQIVTDDTVLRRLGVKQKNQYEVQHIGNRIWRWMNVKTKKVILTGDEGNGFCVILSEQDGGDDDGED